MTTTGTSARQHGGGLQPGRGSVPERLMDMALAAACGVALSGMVARWGAGIELGLGPSALAAVVGASAQLLLSQLWRGR